MKATVGKPLSAASTSAVLAPETVFRAALRLREYLESAHWNGHGLVGPDCGVRINRLVGRFIKSYVPGWGWNDSICYMQAQGYWVLANWRLYSVRNDPRYRDIAVCASEHILERQRSDGAWDYPHPGWKGRVANSEGTWASLGLLESYRHTSDERFLGGALRWHRFLLDKVGFERSGDEIAVNYFAGEQSARVPNNSAFVLRLLAELADLTGGKSFREPCGGMIRFLERAQTHEGEFPYMVKGQMEGGRCWPHFQCYQYNAFEFLDLARYYELTGAEAVRILLAGSLKFLSLGLAADGHAFYECGNHHSRVTYHTGVVAAAFATAKRLGFDGYESRADRAFSYLLTVQKPDGAFPHSKGDYYLLQDRRSYPRPLTMMLFHLLMR